MWCVFPLRPGMKSYRNAAFTGVAIVAIGTLALDMTVLQGILVTLVAWAGNFLTPWQLRTLHLPVHHDQIMHIAADMTKAQKDYQQSQPKEQEPNG